MTVFTGCPLSFETGGTMGYNCCFFLNFVPLHIESPYNFGGTGPILGVKNPLQRVNEHAVFNIWLKTGNQFICHDCIQFNASYQVSVHLAKWFQRRRFFLNQQFRNKNCLWQQCLLTDWDKMCNRYRGPSIDASYQVSLHLANGFQRRRLKCEKLKDDRRWTPSIGKSSHYLWQGELKMWWGFIVKIDIIA